MFHADRVPNKLTGPIQWDFVWEQRTVSEALCHIKHIPAEKACGCGFWAKWDIEESMKWGTTYPSILGAILGWGKVQRHGDEGFRCQYAQIIGFLEPEDDVTISDTLTYTINRNKKVVQNLSKLYDVPMLNKVALKEFALAQGLTFSQLKGELK